MSVHSGIPAGGNWIVDKLKILDTCSRQDAFSNILHESTSNGISPFNILVELARHGATFLFFGVGLTGEDADEHRVLD